MKNFLLILIVLLNYGNFKAQTAGNALHFDGTNDNVTSTLPSFLNDLSTTDFTMEAWVKPEGNVFSRIIFAQGSTSNFATVSTGTTNNIYFYVVESGTTYSVATTNTLPISTWTHVAARWITSTNTVEVFFNGVLQAGANGGTSSTGTINNLSIGTRPGGAQYFPGAIDEVRIWSEARSNCEIEANYKNTMTGTENNLETYFNFDQGTAGGNNTGITSLPDLTGTYNGTLNNFGLTSTTSNWISSGATITSSGNQGSIISNISASSCSNVPYSFNGQFLTTSGIYSDTLTAVSGCDSIVVLNFTSVSTTSSTINTSACGSYLWAQTGQTYSVSGNYMDTIPNAGGCDSVITLNLTINQPVTGIDTQSACSSFTWIDGNTYTSNNTTATYNIVGGAVNGCDSIVTLNLTISNLDLNVTVSPGTLTADQSGAGYQWVDCDNAYAAIPSETSQSYSPALTGNYAVIVTNGACTDTSACHNVNLTGLSESASGRTITIYPNPASGLVNIQGVNSNDVVSVYDNLGEVLFSEKAVYVIDFSKFPVGIYFIKIADSPIYKLIRE